MRLFLALIALCGCAAVGCAPEADAPTTSVPAVPREAPEASGAPRIEGIWVRTGPAAPAVLLFNDDASLRIDMPDSLIGREWDRFADSLVLRYHRGPQDPVLQDSRLRISLLTRAELQLEPANNLFGGHYRRR